MLGGRARWRSQGTGLSAPGLLRSAGRLHYAGGVGTGFSDEVLAQLSGRLAEIASDPPKSLIVAGDPLPNTINWVRPELVAEVQFATWSGSGRVRHAAYLGLREDKTAAEVVREPADPESERKAVRPRPGDATAAQRGPVVAVPPRRNSAIVSARAPKRRGVTMGKVELTHPTANCGRESPSRTSRNTGVRSPITRCPALRAARSRWCAARKGSAASTSFKSTVAVHCRPGSPGRGGWPAVSRDRRCRWADCHGADLGDRTACLGCHRGRSAAPRPDGVRSRSR